MGRVNREGAIPLGSPEASRAGVGAPAVYHAARPTRQPFSPGRSAADIIEAGHSTSVFDRLAFRPLDGTRGGDCHG
jgi:hypothetical protein